MGRDLLLIAMALFTWGIGEGMFFYFQPIYLNKMGADPIQIGAILGAYGVANAVVHVPAGYLADTIGRRPLLWMAWIMGLLASWWMALANNLTWFVAGMLIYAITGFVSSPLNSYVTAARGKWTVSQAVLLISASFNLGIVIGPILGGLIGDQLGLKQVFFGAGVIFILSTALVLLVRPQPIEKHSTEQSRHEFLNNSRYRFYLLAVFLAAFATFLPQTFSQNFLHDQRGLSLSAIGRLLSIAGLGVVILSFTFGRIKTRYGFLLSQVSVAIFSLTLCLGSGLPWFAIGYFFLGGYKTTRTLAAAQTRTLVHAANMGLAYGITELVASSATILAPLLAGLLYSREPASVFSFSILITIAAIAAGARFSPVGT